MAEPAMTGEQEYYVPGDGASFRGAIYRLSSAQVLTDVLQDVLFDTVAVDTEGWTGVTANFFVIPDGSSGMVRASVYLNTTVTRDGSVLEADIRVSNQGFSTNRIVAGANYVPDPSPSGTHGQPLTMVSPPFPITGPSNVWVEALYASDNGASALIGSNACWFALEFLGDIP